MRSSALVIACLTGGCTGGMYDPSTVEQQEGACVALEDRRFESVNMLECGLTPDGPAPCRWSLTFAIKDDLSTSFVWNYSDVGEAGTIECQGARITAVAGSRPVAASFDPVTQKLVWEGQTYAPAN